MTSEPPRPPGDRYTPIRLLGAGGQGSVWLCRDERLRRDVALKHLPLTGGMGESSGSAVRRRARREAQTMARIKHPVVVNIHDVIDTDPRSLWLVMEHVTGPSLGARVKENGVLGAQAAARIGLEVLSGLEAVHRAGIVHRDVKPPNIVVAGDPEGDFQVVLVDFGIALIVGGARLTDDHFVVGSRGYTAPERLFRGDPGSSASDLWSLGATLHFAVYGTPPGYDAYGHDSSRRHGSALDGVIDHLLIQDPHRRARAREAREELKRIAEGPHSQPPPVSRPPRPLRHEPPGLERRPHREKTAPARGEPAGSPGRVAGELAELEPPEAARRLSGIASTDERTAIEIMERLNTGTAARLLRHLESQPAALLFEGIHVLDAARIIRQVDPRTAAHGMRKMPVSSQVSILKEVDRQHAEAGRTRSTSAPAVLGAYTPAHAADLVRADPWVRYTVLPKVSETERRYITRELGRHPSPGG